MHPKDTADLFRHKCSAHHLRGSHRTDVIASEQYKFMYLVNVKAASTSFKRVLLSHLDAGYCTNASHGLMVDAASKSCMGCQLCTCTRTTTQCFDDRQLEREHVLRWSFVRNPVTKFESGARQMRQMEPERFGRLSVDAILDLQLRMEKWLPTGAFLNEHLEPSSYRLSGNDAHGKKLWPHFIGKLENLEDSHSNDWRTLLGSLHLDVAGPFRAKAAALNQQLPFIRPGLYANSTDPTHAVGAKLSDDSVRRLCDSPNYAHEWRCFGYALPSVCATNSSLLCCTM